MSARVPPVLLLHVHDVLSAFDHLLRTSQLVLLKFDRLGERTSLMREFSIAAVGYVMQIAVEAGYDVQTIRGMESDLIAYLKEIP